ncbi:relaxase/mobilization nuclease domain-containing protein [Dyadobacter pollutisoli]|uniref:Relaxase/mobilization nuclease domain-containing protein n=1 Tax=Dyadobacter pollutisoli TaxID=2910158 RepID=A0A9E8SKY3_9BACT|nr:relaxase/mobilization nuclease domain-containing protein [Dyadobacter pollutisoli]WAC12438.1 relaxase/mobilization nuclease domain-containing protein [Dyadobacter pollutisoli]
MIGKAGLGSYAKGILQYCYYDKTQPLTAGEKIPAENIRGELVYIQNLAIKTGEDGTLDLDYLARQYTDNHAKNRKLTKYIWHQSFSFSPGEKPGNDKIRQIVAEFAKEFGFENNQMVVFKHEDSANLHFHIIANRINHNGKNTADHFKNYARTGKFARRMENELDLTQTRDMRINRAQGQKIPLQDKAHAKLRALIDRLKPQVSSVQDLKERLLKEGYKTYVGRGIAFFHIQSKMKVKGSDIGRDYSLASLENWMSQTGETGQNPKLKKRRRKRKDIGLHL